MLNRKLKHKSLNLKLYISVFGLPPLIIFGLCGCYVADFLTPNPPPYDYQIRASYDMTLLKNSSSAEVLTILYIPELELLSQSKSILAAHGQNKKGYKNWLTMVAFDENDMLAKRKYLLVADEKPKILFVEPWENLSFDCQMVLESEVFEEPYANENAKRIAILRRVLENSKNDIKQVSSDNKMIEICGALINQAIGAVLVKLDSSPALATRLSEPSGLAFSHMSMDRGKVGMIIKDDVVAVRIRTGSLTGEFENITPESLSPQPAEQQVTQ